MLGAFRWESALRGVRRLGVILSAVYMLWMFQRVYYGEVTNPKNERLAGPVAPRVGDHPAGPRHGDSHGRAARTFSCSRWSRVNRSECVQRIGAVPDAERRNVDRAACRPAARPRANADAGFFFRCHRPDALRHPGGHCRHGGRGVPRQGRADADRRPRRHRPRLRAGVAPSCSGDATNELRAWSTPTTSGCSSPSSSCIVGLLTIALSGRRRSSAKACRRASTTR